VLRPKPTPRFLDAKRTDDESNDGVNSFDNTYEVGDGHVTLIYDRKAAEEQAIAAAVVTSNLRFAFTIIISSLAC
jgi:hypothetical protein